MSERDPQIPDTVEGEPVVGVEPATEPLTPEEVREAQRRDQEEADGNACARIDVQGYALAAMATIAVLETADHDTGP
jgi:hypothetical protein